MKNALRKLWVWISTCVAKTKWPSLFALVNGGLYYSLKEEDHDRIRQLLKDNYLLVLSRRKCHLTTLVITILSWFVSHRFAHYTHSLMNVEGDLEGHIGYKLIEATQRGVHYSTFMEVFDCDSVCLLSPRGVPLEEWTRVMDYVKESYGKEYDDFFDITSDQQVSCVELIYWGLRRLPDFEQRFPNLIKLITEQDQLTPQMLLDTGEFDVVFEVRR